MQNYRYKIITVLLVTALIVITGCGYQLRGYNYTLSNINSLYISYKKISFNQINDRFIHNFVNNLKTQHIRVISDFNNNTNDRDTTNNYKLEVTQANYSKNIISTGSNKLITQYKIIYNVTYNLYRYGKPLLTKQRISTERNYNYSQDQILGLDNEEEIIIDDILQETSNKIIMQINVATKKQQ